MLQTAGSIIVLFVIAQLGVFVFAALQTIRANRDRHQLSLKLLEEQIVAARVVRVRNEQKILHWNGIRKMKVDRKIDEAKDICSFYLTPHDGKPLPLFRPGQYLTFRLRIPGHERTVVRCYSLSDSPSPDCYRVTIKRVNAPRNKPKLPPGLVSNYFHDKINEGDILDVEAPRGQFTIDPFDRHPIVLIGGGVGITPLLSMTNAIIASQVGREVWLFYGVRCGREQMMAQHLRELAERYDSFHLVVCYSAPELEDIEDRDYHFRGHVSVDLLTNVLKVNNFNFYVCGPPPMMDALFDGLKKWGVPKDRILTEAFGPATVKKAFPPPVAESADGKETPAAPAKIRFCRSDKSCVWDASAGNLLDFALDNGVEIDAGCRAGNCGTCAVAVETGRIDYVTECGFECEVGTYLTCIGVPNGDGDLELDA